MRIAREEGEVIGPDKPIHVDRHDDRGTFNQQPDNVIRNEQRQPATYRLQEIPTDATVPSSREPRRARFGGICRILFVRRADPFPGGVPASGGQLQPQASNVCEARLPDSDTPDTVLNFRRLRFFVRSLALQSRYRDLSGSHNLSGGKGPNQLHRL